MTEALKVFLFLVYSNISKRLIIDCTRDTTHLQNRVLLRMMNRLSIRWTKQYTQLSKLFIHFLRSRFLSLSLTSEKVFVGMKLLSFPATSKKLYQTSAKVICGHSIFSLQWRDREENYFLQTNRTIKYILIVIDIQTSNQIDDGADFERFSSTTRWFDKRSYQTLTVLFRINMDEGEGKKKESKKWHSHIDMT